MTRRVGFVVGWLAATVVAVLISMTAVSLVGANVVDQPSAVFVTTTQAVALEAEEATASSASSVSAPSSTITEPTVGTTLPSSSTSTSSPSTTSTSTSSETTTTTSAGSSTTTSTTAPSSTTTSTTSPESTTTTTEAETTGPFTYPVTGGSVTISCDGDAISLGGAVPSSGWQVEVEKSGPDEVRVTFQSGESEVEIRIECEDGVPNAEVDADD